MHAAITSATAAVTGAAGMDRSAVAVVVITRNRRPQLLSTLSRLLDLPEVSEVIVVDNASDDGTPSAVTTAYPRVRLIESSANLGAVGRTIGVQLASAPIVAFADDDSWWKPGSLARAAEVFDRNPRLGLLHARLVVEPQGIDDPICRQLAGGPRRGGAPGPAILGHLACGVLLRKAAYLEVGGYSPLLGFGGEERLLSLDLAVAGWHQCYRADVVAHHEPSTAREPWSHRQARCRRNDTLTALLRLPLHRAVTEARELARQAVRDPAARRELATLVRRVPGALRQRRRIPPELWHEMVASEIMGPGHPVALRPG